MNNHGHNEAPLEGSSPQEERLTQGAPVDWEKELQQTLKLGEQFTDFAVGTVDLARTEVLLAAQTLPKVMMLWLIMMPIILLAWCAFSVLMAWAIFAASTQMGLALLVVFLLQVLLLLSCRWLFGQYRLRMTLPFTRAHISDFIRSLENESGRKS